MNKPNLTRFSYILPVALAAALVALPAGALEGQSDSCLDHEHSRDRASHCEVRDYTVASTDLLDIDAAQNGGVEVIGTSRSDVAVSASVWAYARTEERARELTNEVRVTTQGGRLRAEGPRAGRRSRETWGVNWHIEVPTQTDLRIETFNGGIMLDNVDGRIRFDALNGGVHLVDLAGEVRGRTTNGGLQIELSGERWDGREMDVETTNGGVTISVPEGYSAQLETGTVNGGLEFDFPVMVRGRVSRKISTQLGDGGPRIRAMTTNGRVRVRTAR